MMLRRLRSSWNLRRLDQVFLAIILLLMTLVWVLPIWRFPRIVEPGALAALHYNVYFGVDALGPWVRILWLPGVVSVLVLLDLVLAFYERSHALLRYRLLLGTAVLTLMFANVALLFILLVNV